MSQRCRSPYHRECNESSKVLDSAQERSPRLLSRKRALLPSSATGIRPSRKKQRTAIIVSDIKVVAPPESSFYSSRLSFNVFLPPKEQLLDIGSVNKAMEESSSSWDDDFSSTSSQDTVPPPSAHVIEQQEDDEWATKHLDEDSACGKEKRTMDKSDQDGSSQKYIDSMTFLWKQDCNDNVQSLPQLITVDNRGRPSDMKNEHGKRMISISSIPTSWKLYKHRRRLRRRSASSSTCKNKGWVTIGNSYVGDPPSNNDDTTKSKVAEIDVLHRDYKTVRQSLPKWITSVQTPGDRARIFTRSQFVRHVIVETEKEVSDEILCDARFWSVFISENNPDDSVSYLLEARAPSKYLDVLREKTILFVRAISFMQNSEALLRDSESLLVDVSLSLTATGSLGLTLAPDHRAYHRHAASGVWIIHANPDSKFCQLLGGRMAFGNGCVLLAINDATIASPKHAKELLQVAEGTEQRGQRPFTKVTVCLSRYATFMQSTDRSALEIRNMDGSRFNSEKKVNFD
ncbi:hypothetical protein IV203_012296 [Nitzschia inconspicua]|uniref:Uncharacterized protein n=1 Tax=Nitzschia inconspicua TaxID=303405 RepID=A0A9K3KTG5_9STRA|nr:hypothetical protein IV203_012296 [Nitzschia inconspicua]